MKDSVLSRRNILRIGSLAGLGGLSLTQLSTPSLAVQSGISSSSQSVALETTDGTITDVQIDQSTLDFTLQYRNIKPGEKIQLSLKARIADAVSETGKHAFEEIATGYYELPDYMGTATEDDFTLSGFSTGIISNHSSITASDFTASNEGETETTPVELRVEFSWKNVTSEAVLNYSINITNTAPSTPTNGLLAHYEFNQDLTDSVGANDGTGYGTLQYVSRAGGNAVSLSGTTYIDTESQIFSSFDTVTLAAWVRTTDSNGAVFGQWGGSSSEVVELRISGGRVKLTVDIAGDSNVQTLTAPDTVADGAWHHIVVTFDDASNTGVIYVDGTQVQSGTITNSPSPTDTYKIGRISYNNQNLNADVDDARLYNKVLTSTEVNTLYNETK